MINGAVIFNVTSPPKNAAVFFSRRYNIKKIYNYKSFIIINKKINIGRLCGGA